jgi:putative FmdB family regulatory protein
MAMPIYEYECLDCGIHFERVQRFSDPPVEECPNGHRHVRRVFHAPGIIFKGSGFYTTDYARKSSNGGEKKEEKGEEKK